MSFGLLGPALKATQAMRALGIALHLPYPSKPAQVCYANLGSVKTDRTLLLSGLGPPPIL